MLFVLRGYFTWSNLTFASVPPHPRIQKLLKEKKIEVPYYLQHREELLQRGVNAPWSSSARQSGKKMNSIVLQRSLGPTAPPTGSWKALVILVKFSDKPKSVTATKFDTLIFGTATGTLRDYYRKVSYNNLDIVTVNLPSAIGWEVAPQTYAFYANGQNGLGGYPQNA